MERVNLNELLLCRNLLKNELVVLLADCISNRQDKDILAKTTAMLMEQAEKIGLAGNIISGYILFLLTNEENLAAKIIEKSNGKIGESIKKAFYHDVEIIFPLLKAKPEALLGFDFLADYKPAFLNENTVFNDFLAKVDTAESFAAIAEDLLDYYKCYGYGDMSIYRAFRWENDKLIGIKHFEAGRLADLIGYEHQKEQLVENTEAFIQGKPANNVLLVGARGTGKSSSVKALANEYYHQGLRIIQMTKPELSNLANVIDYLRDYANKYFIIFLDDLSFEESDAEYKYLKSAIEGGVESIPKNILLYATSNRRHLIRESWRDRIDGQDELYRDDSINETISLSDRFGLIIHYYAPDQQEYLAIISHILKKHGIELNDEELRVAGLRWEMSHSGRSGRTAQQFVAHYLGKQ